MDETAPHNDFLGLLNQYRGAIHRVSRMYGTSLDDREDLVQEIVYQLWRAWPSYRREAAAITWIYRIALNSAISALRRRSRRPTPVALEAASDVPTTASNESSDERIELLYRAIRSLGDVDRALLMCYLDDLSYRQIADVLGISETNVGARLTRTKAKLQELVREMR